MTYQQKPKRVAIIGAGASGLAAVKECLEFGLLPTCFEQKDDIGGLWYRQNPIPDDVTVAARVYSNLQQNSTKVFYTYSDFPSFKQHPLFLSPDHMKEYLEAYAKEFDLMPYIKLRHYVERVEKAGDYETTGRWIVTTTDNKTRDRATETFDAVFCASGFYSKRRPYGNLPGRETFGGTISHVGDYWDANPYIGRTVLLIGGSVSSVDIASQLAAVGAKKVVIVSKDGFWCAGQILDGKPIDAVLFNRRHRTTTSFPKLQKYWTQLMQNRFDHGQLGFCPKTPLLQGRIAVSNDIDKWIHAGIVEHRIGELTEFVRDGVLLTNGDKITVDDIIYCTGYIVDFPYLDRRHISSSEVMQDDMWMYMYPIHQKHPTLWLLVALPIFAPAAHVGELQCRYACGVLNGSIKLLPVEKMAARIEQEKKASIGQWGFWPGMLVDWYAYASELATLVGCWPSFYKVAIKSPKLAWTIFNGPLLAQQFRLVGPNAKWEVAKTILEEVASTHYGCGLPANFGWIPPKKLPAGYAELCTGKRQ